MPQAITIEALKVRYRNGALGVTDVNLSLEPGRLGAIVGPNGAGKTTIARAIGGFMRSEGARVVSGKITLFGDDTTNLEPHLIARRGVAIVPERDKVFTTLTVQDNLLALGKSTSSSARNRYLESAFELFPILSTRRGEQAGKLSGGERQMLAIAAAMMLRPRILIVDEMTLGLHYLLHRPLYDVARQIADQGTTVLIVDEGTTASFDFVDLWVDLVDGVSGAPRASPRTYPVSNEERNQ